MVDFMRFSLLMSSIMIMLPSFLFSELTSGSTVELTETFSPSISSSASTVISESWVSSDFLIFSMTQALGPTKKSAAAWPMMAFSVTLKMRRPAALQVTTLPSSSSVMTPLVMLCSMLSL